jgi:carbonic anhydrase
MKKLIEGILRFQNEVYARQRELYHELSAGQAPRWLLITCSDSRVVPNLISQTDPGQLFICRNAGNIVPAHGYPSGGVSATIEYAVQVLMVKHIVVCGHSDCGAMKAVLHPEKLAGLPAVAHWVSYADRARAVVLETLKDAPEEQQIEALIDENVLAQLDNLRTLPSVAAKVRSGALGIHGMVYDIRSGRFRMWDADSHRWRPIEEIAASFGCETAGARE